MLPLSTAEEEDGLEEEEEEMEEVLLELQRLFSTFSTLSLDADLTRFTLKS